MGVAESEYTAAEARQKMEGEEAIATRTRKVRKKPTELSHNLPALAAEVVGIDAGDEIAIDIYDDCFVVRRAGDE